jgi:hypothetical protein
MLILIKFWLPVLILTLAILWVRITLQQKPLPFIHAFGMATAAVLVVYALLYGISWLVSL